MSRNKCKQALPFLLGLVTLLLLLQTNLFGLIHSEHSAVDSAPGSRAHSPLKRVDNFDDASDSANLPRALRKVNPVAPAHMGVQRKDLDLSDDPSAAITRSNDTQLLAYLIRKTGREKSQAIQSIIRVAHALEAYGAHPDSNGDPVLSNGRRPLPSAAVSDHDTTATKAPPSRPRVSVDVARKLTSIVLSMKAAHARKPKVSNTRLDIYESDDNR